MGCRFMATRGPQGVDDPNHSLRILAAVPLQLLPYLPALLLRHFAEVNPQVFKARLPTLLNLQIGILTSKGLSVRSLCIAFARSRRSSGEAHCYDSTNEQHCPCGPRFLRPEYQDE
jgi:hypothetical protein